VESTFHALRYLSGLLSGKASSESFRITAPGFWLGWAIDPDFHRGDGVAWYEGIRWCDIWVGGDYVDGRIGASWRGCIGSGVAVLGLEFLVVFREGDL